MQLEYQMIRVTASQTMSRVATMSVLSVLPGNYEQEWSKSMVHRELQGALLVAINNQEMEEREALKVLRSSWRPKLFPDGIQLVRASYSLIQNLG